MAASDVFNFFMTYMFEPILDILYALLLLVIVTATDKHLKTPFYIIFVAGGVSAIVINLSSYAIYRYWEFQAGTALAVPIILAFLANGIAFVFHTLSVFLIIVDRYISIIYILNPRRFWNKRLILSILFGCLVVSLLVNIFYYKAYIQWYVLPNGEQAFNNIAPEIDEIARIAYGAIGGIFVIISLPLNIIIAIKMNPLIKQVIGKDQRRAARQQLLLTWTALLTVIAHAVQAAHQFVWLVSIAFADEELTTYLRTIVGWVTDLTIFTPPLFILLLSSQTRNAATRFVRRRVSITDISSTTTPKRTYSLQRTV